MQRTIARLAEKTLSGELLNREDAAQLAATQGDDVYDLFYWANKIRVQFVGRDVRFCAIVAGKAGGCSEDCKFCSQSAHHQTAVGGQTMLTDQQILDSASHAAEVGADSFGIVNSGRGPTRSELEDWLKPILMKIATEGKTRACATLGALTPDTAQFLHDCGIRRINHNLETSQRHYPNIVSTHPYSERLNTLRVAKAAGMSLCSGGIFGLGEVWEDRLDMLFTLREIGVDVMPINFLNAIGGTPLADQPMLEPMECLKIISICRFVLPDKELKVAGGREKVLRDLQSWIFFAGADSTMIGNYLTTYGRTPQLDHQMVRDLGLQWKAYAGGSVPPTLADPMVGRGKHSSKYNIPILYEREVTGRGQPERLGRWFSRFFSPTQGPWLPCALAATTGRRWLVSNVSTLPMPMTWPTSSTSPPSARPSPVAIIGAGLVSPLGASVRQTWNALMDGRHIIDHARVGIELPGRKPRINEIAWIAACEAAAEAGWSSSELSSPQTALVLATSKGPVDAWLGDTNARFPARGPSQWGLADLADSLAADLGIVGPRLTICAACASGLYALIRGMVLLREPGISRALIVAAESSLHPLFLGSFARLGVLAPPGGLCRPLDQYRQGFLMSEAAAAVCLQTGLIASTETNEGEVEWPAVPGAAAPRPVWIDRVAMGSEGTHLTGGSGYRSAVERLVGAVIDGRPVDIVHAHATATIANDAAELEAIESGVSPGSGLPLVYSHKGALGHSLGAAGLVAVVLNRQMHLESMVPPNALTDHPLAAQRVRIRQSPTPLPAAGAALRRSIAMAAGFGGSMAVVGLASRG